MKAKELIEMIKDFEDKEVYFGDKDIVEVQICEEGIWLHTFLEEVTNDKACKNYEECAEK